MTKRMLIDATHPEETRVVVVDGNRLEDFDFETATKKQLKGNIYLARVTRVEPSLQAAFVEYGGNRHGFLAFSEIHPDYYRIPIEDREALLREERARASEELDEDVDEPEVPDEPAESADGGEAAGEAQDRPETVGGDPVEEVRRKRKSHVNRRYKIQEVVARRQIMLVQVVKEERGNKGAALTTYLSLAGRYCVLMPNTARGGGVSRKITHAGDRKRLKQIVEGLDVPDGMAVIVRTAGSERTKTEIKRDYEYLLRLWDDIRETTLKSTAPCLIYEEANLIKRSIRDLYARDIDEVQVEGEDGYRIAKDFMKALVPSHAKRVQPYRDPHTPLLHRFQVESQLDAIHSPVVELKSGGYIVLNQTEALVAIDVNSGRATSERNIEETALKTNMEAADEVARQLRLRDLAGLIVIDFIDMEESRNQHAVERRMKEAMKSDRARIQIGRISHFGLMELSRQRLRPSLFEASTQVCPHCKGTGHVRSTESSALHVLRVIEEEGLRNRSAELVVYVPASIALYILNHKRERLAEIEQRYGFTVMLEQDESLTPPDHRMDRRRPKTAEERAAFQSAASALPPPVVEEDDDLVDEVDEDEDERPAGDRSAAAERSSGDDERGGRRSRRRRRGGRRRGGEGAEDRAAEDRPLEDRPMEAGSEDDEGDADQAEHPGSDERAGESEEDENARKRRRRGRRGGRRRSRRREDETSTGESESGEAGSDETDSDEPDGDRDEGEATDAGETERQDAEPVAAAGSEAAPEPVIEAVAEPVTEPATEIAEPPVTAAAVEATPAEAVAEAPAEVAEKPAKPKRAPRRRKKVEAEEPAAAEPVTEAAPEPAAVEEAAAPAEAAAVEDRPITGQEGHDQTVGTEADSTVEEPDVASSPVAVKTIDAPVEKPKKGWWRR
ncbi:MAG: Rne/Rng family ribonuclease [Thalassobaculum sp.]|uniref:Rne/Rng family ribonuclease n=2 Tax=Thalassobaculum sp. TaxID=2022740 RepID=UPI0032EB50C1